MRAKPQARRHGDRRAPPREPAFGAARASWAFGRETRHARKARRWMGASAAHMCLGKNSIWLAQSPASIPSVRVPGACGGRAAWLLLRRHCGLDNRSQTSGLGVKQSYSALGQGLGRRPAFVVARASSRRQRQSRNARKGRLPAATWLVSERPRDSRALRRLSAVHGSRVLASRPDCQASAGRYRVAGWSGQGRPNVTQPGRRPSALTT